MLAGFIRLRSRPLAVFGLVLVLAHVAMAALAPVVLTVNPLSILDMPLQPPGPDALLGTDELGRDFLTRLLYGGRTAISVALLAGGIATLGGGLLGLAAARAGGWFDHVVSRLTEVQLSVPPILTVSLFVAALGQSTAVLVAVSAIILSTGVIRTARAQGLNLMQSGYVKAAILRGESGLSIVLRELLPNAAELLAVEFALRASAAFLLVSALSFLGLGISAPTPDWGLMVSEGLSSLRYQPWLVVMPALMISSLVVGINFATEGLSEIFGLEAARGGA